MKKNHYAVRIERDEKIGKKKVVFWVLKNENFNV